MRHPLIRLSALPHLEYICVDSTSAVVETSIDGDRLGEGVGYLSPGVDIFELLPELYGLEEVMAAIRQGEQSYFELKAIARPMQDGTLRYWDLYLTADDRPENTDGLMLIFEEVSDRMQLEQTLVQASNEMSLVVERLSASETYVENLLHSMPDALLVTKLSGEIVKTNQIALDLLGYEAAELLGRPLLDLLADKSFDVSEIQRFLFEDEGEILKHIELVCQRKDRGKPIVSFSCSVKPAQGNDPAQFIYIGRDITKTYRAQRRAMAQNTVTQVLSQAYTFAEALPRLLQGIAEGLDWDICEFWQPTSDDGESARELHCIDIWTKPFIDTSEWTRLSFEGQCGWIESTWQNKQAIWLSDLGELKSLRQEVARSLLLQTGLFCPLTVGQETIGAIALFAQNDFERDEDLIQMMNTIGNQIGQFFQRKLAEEALRREQMKTEKLLLNILPKPIAEQLKDTPTTIAEHYEMVTILFADIVGFTSLSSQIPAPELVKLLNYVFSAFDRLSEQYGLEKIKTIGDAYMVVGGLPAPRADHAEATAYMALDMQQAITEFNRQTYSNLDLRIGIHSGPVVAGVIGLKKFVYDLWGDTVNTASRMESHGIAGQIQVSAETAAFLESDFVLTQRGNISVKGKGEMTTYLLLGRKGEALDSEASLKQLPVALQANHDVADLIRRRLRGQA